MSPSTPQNVPKISRITFLIDYLVAVSTVAAVAAAEHAGHVGPHSLAGHRVHEVLPVLLPALPVAEKKSKAHWSDRPQPSTTSRQSAVWLLAAAGNQPKAK